VAANVLGWIVACGGAGNAATTAGRATASVEAALAPGTFDAGAARCTTRALAARRALATAIARAGGVTALADRDLAELVSVVRRCAADALSTKVLSAGAITGLERGELRCASRRVTRLAPDVLARVVSIPDLRALSAGDQVSLRAVAFECAPRAIGQLFVEQFAAGVGVSTSELPVTDADLRCYGEGIREANQAATVGETGSTTVAGGPVLARCPTPLTRHLLTLSFATLGLDGARGACVVDRLMADPPTMREFLGTTASGTLGLELNPTQVAVLVACN
jgi:hypothetical protein